MANLRLSNDFTLPAEAVTETFAILAKRGVGKTYTASVLVEELLKAGLRTVASGGVCGRRPMASALDCRSSSWAATMAMCRWSSPPAR
jgi:hypothetical protein